ncbi:unnamed protein product [Effrenium voratum]|uniref:Lipoprotein n=1 Tax=Effrenium voratum TaxID=2562239 RepID=A0AA36HPD3_9DINO|nr:unnamed protein product [Effrenium voratum]CAJ1441036.1 unnamed protein product [Effrenium voratum]
MARGLSIALLCVAASLLSCAFVPPGTVEGSALRGAPARGVLAISGGLAAAVPTQAQAFSENELNQFGLVFALFFLGFFIAGLVRMFTVGKL